MNHDLLEKFFRDSKNVKLHKQKKDSIRESVFAYIKQRPLEKIAQKNPWSIASLYSIFNFKYANTLLAGSLMVLLLAGGAVSVKADSSLPGDLLYPIKVNFNEKIMESVAFSVEAKVKLSIALAQRRLQEAETLAVEHKATAKTSANINANFNNHAKKASAVIRKLNHGALSQTIAHDFEASLRAHAHIMNSLAQSNPETLLNTTIADVNKTVLELFKARQEENKKMQNDIPKNEINKKDALTEKISAAQDAIIKTKKAIDGKKGSLGSKETLELETNLALAQQKIDEGKQTINQDADNYHDSISSLQEASIIAKESEALLQEKTKLGIDINITIDANYDISKQQRLKN